MNFRGYGEYVLDDDVQDVADFLLASDEMEERNQLENKNIVKHYNIKGEEIIYELYNDDGMMKYLSIGGDEYIGATAGDAVEKLDIYVMLINESVIIGINDLQTNKDSVVHVIDQLQNVTNATIKALKEEALKIRQGATIKQNNKGCAIASRQSRP